MGWEEEGVGRLVQCLISPISWFPLETWLAFLRSIPNSSFLEAFDNFASRSF